MWNMGGVDKRDAIRKKTKDRGDQGQTKVVWVYREGSAAQRGKGTAKWHMVRRTRKHSKREG